MRTDSAPAKEICQKRPLLRLHVALRLAVIFFSILVSRHTNQSIVIMSFYDEIEIEDMTYHESTTLYTYPCPCGDQFEISLSDLRDGEEVAVCPSCSLTIKVIFEVVSTFFELIDSRTFLADWNFVMQTDLPEDKDGAAPAAPVQAVTA